MAYDKKHADSAFERMHRGLRESGAGSTFGGGSGDTHIHVHLHGGAEGSPEEEAEETPHEEEMEHEPAAAEPKKKRDPLAELFALKFDKKK